MKTHISCEVRPLQLYCVNTRSTVYVGYSFVGSGFGCLEHQANDMFLFCGNPMCSLPRLSLTDSERGRPRHLPGSPLRVFFLSGRHQQLPFCLPRLLLGVPKDIHQRQVGRCQHHGGRRRRDG
ncbi:unnamed protein product [Pylaiella littoralis]